MPYGSGCKVQFSLPKNEAAQLQNYASAHGITSDNLAAKKLLLLILNRPSLLKTGDLDSVAIREKLEVLERRSLATELSTGELAQRLVAFGQESPTRDQLSTLRQELREGVATILDAIDTPSPLPPRRNKD